MKMLFLTRNSFEETLSEIFEKEEGTKVTCKSSFLEEEEKDVVIVKGNSFCHVFSIIDLFEKLNRHFSVSIQSYDVMDIAEFGDGYAFFIK